MLSTNHGRMNQSVMSHLSGHALKRALIARNRVRRRLLLVSLLTCAMVAVLAPVGGLASFGASAAVGASAPQEFGLLFTVNSTSDGGDAAKGDGLCETATGNSQCTLRAAIEEANASPGDDGIEFWIPLTEPFCDGTGRCVINLTSALPDLITNMEINGPGPDKLTVRRSTGGDYRIFLVERGTVVSLSGMTISNGKVFSPIEGGGGIYNDGNLTITNCILSVNDAAFGGGLFNGGVLNITNSTLANNSGENGGGIFDFGSWLNITGSRLANNSARDSGGGIYNNFDDRVAIYNSTLSGNSANGTPSEARLGSGGGVNNRGGNVSVFNSTLSGNFANSRGGGIASNGTLVVRNSTISGNVADDALDRAEGGGISAYTTTVISSSIIALNTDNGPANDVAGTFTSQGFNLIGKTDGSTGFAESTDQTGTIASPLDPQLDPAGLQDNGGPTQTIALQPGSPAIDKGTSNGLTTDQRGVARTFDDPTVANAIGGDGTDIGAFELQPLTDTDGDGTPDAFDQDDDNDGVLDIDDNCPLVANPDQTDTDGDGLGNACDPDDDNDGVPDEQDAFPLDPNESVDMDGDGIGDNADPDDDNDGILDTVDNCPLTANPAQADFDRDGIGDVCDPQTGPPVNKNQCKNNGWKRFDTPRRFMSQGDCIQFVTSGS